MNTNLPTHYTASGMALLPDDVRTRRVADQAVRWLGYVTSRSRQRPETLVAKAVQSAAFSAAQGAANLAIPTKLQGTSTHQAALWALVRDPAAPWAELSVEPSADPSASGLVVCHDGDALGQIQTKHVPWLRPLLPFGARVHLSRVTGAPYGYTLGLNVVLAVGKPLDRLLDALGTSGDSGGDGAPSRPMPSAGVALEHEVSAGDGATQHATLTVSQVRESPLRLVVRPEHEALDAHPDDVVLYRRLDGTAGASVAHVVRHSPTGLDWGMGSGAAGRADLALSVLSRLASPDVADEWSARFASEVVARVPRAGGVLRAADVRAWIDDQTNRPPTAE